MYYKFTIRYDILFRASTKRCVLLERHCQLISRATTNPVHIERASGLCVACMCLCVCPSVYLCARGTRELGMMIIENLFLEFRRFLRICDTKRTKIQQIPPTLPQICSDISPSFNLPLKSIGVFSRAASASKGRGCVLFTAHKFSTL